MGFSIAWIAVKGAPLEQVLLSAGLENTSARAEYATAPFTGQSLADGWHLLVARRCDSHLISNKVLAKLSLNCQVVGCSVEEHVMFSSAEFWQNGQRNWKVEHASEQDLRHLKSEGTTPTTYEGHVAKAKLLQDQDPEVDCFFEVPLLLAQELCRFKHDESCEGLDYEKFSVYEKNMGPRKWWQVWRSA
jgi:hypothetical protein